MCATSWRTSHLLSLANRCSRAKHHAPGRAVRERLTQLSYEITSLWPGHGVPALFQLRAGLP